MDAFMGFIIVVSIAVLLLRRRISAWLARRRKAPEPLPGIFGPPRVRRSKEPNDGTTPRPSPVPPPPRLDDGYKDWTATAMTQLPGATKAEAEVKRLEQEESELSDIIDELEWELEDDDKAGQAKLRRLESRRKKLEDALHRAEDRVDRELDRTWGWQCVSEPELSMTAEELKAIHRVVLRANWHKFPKRLKSSLEWEELSGHDTELEGPPPEVAGALRYHAIMESSASREEKIQLIDQLIAEDRAFRAAFCAYGEDGAALFQEGEMADVFNIPGVGEARVAALAEAGYDSIEKLKAATAADLKKVSGIGPKLAADIVAAVLHCLRARHDPLP